MFFFSFFSACAVRCRAEEKKKKKGYTYEFLSAGFCLALMDQKESLHIGKEKNCFAGNEKTAGGNFARNKHQPHVLTPPSCLFLLGEDSGQGGETSCQCSVQVCLFVCVCVFVWVCGVGNLLESSFSRIATFVRPFSQGDENLHRVCVCIFSCSVYVCVCVCVCTETVAVGSFSFKCTTTKKGKSVDKNVLLELLLALRWGSNPPTRRLKLSQEPSRE